MNDENAVNQVHSKKNLIHQILEKLPIDLIKNSKKIILIKKIIYIFFK